MDRKLRDGPGGVGTRDGLAMSPLEYTEPVILEPLTCVNEWSQGDSNPIHSLRKQALSCSECSLMVLRRCPVSCGAGATADSDRRTFLHRVLGLVRRRQRQDRGLNFCGAAGDFGLTLSDPLPLSSNRAHD